MSSAFERMQKLAEQKKKAQLELLPSETAPPPLDDVVYHTDENVVDHNSTDVVNNITTKENVVNKITTKKNVVDHSKRKWSTTDRKRSKYGETVESFRTSIDFKQQIKVFCAKNKLDKQDFYRIVVNHYFETVVDHKEEDVVRLFTYDDLRLMTLFKTKALIINLYLRYNSIFNEKTRWTVRDDDAGQSVNNYDIKIIELGIIQTQANKRYEGKINSFSYYLPEINNFFELNLSEDILQAMLDVNRKRWQQQSGKTIDLDFLSE